MRLLPVTPAEPPTTVGDDAEGLLALNEWGYCVRPGVLGAETVRTLRETIEDVAAEARRRESRFETKRVQKVPIGAWVDRRGCGSGVGI